VNSRPGGLRGFTLIEMIITVAIVGLLAAGVLPLAELAYKRAHEQDLRVALREVRTAIDAYKAAADQGRIITEPGSSGYPPTLSALVEGVIDARDPEGAKIYFLRRVPRDPLFPDAQAAPETTWGLRSYASPAENPQTGDDVFDVFSLSGGIGINGVAYRNW
jgi:general secretion pathway protein G